MPEISRQPSGGPNGLEREGKKKFRYMAYNKLKSLENNVRAIETALAVRSQKRKATQAEKETMSLYSGFGGIKEVLNIGTEKPMPQNMESLTDRLLTALRNHADGNAEWYDNAVDSIKTSVLSFLHPCLYNRHRGTADTGHVQDARTYDAHIP